MKSRKFVLMLGIALLGSALASGAAFAGGGRGGHGGHGGARVSVGVAVGPGWWGPRPYWGGPYWGGSYWGGPYWGGPYWGSYSPYYYPPVVVQPAPQVYIERDPVSVAPAPQQQAHWWYFCPGSNAYYPYVRECPGGWQRVAPQPPPPS
ncbi:MAG TPA: hypothetical protein VLD36_21100 [Burkholderiales bacterium]|nr:hypothetical protein [Burkholderiales bacterium]